jgi:hypothetical protein
LAEILVTVEDLFSDPSPWSCVLFFSHGSNTYVRGCAPL